MKSIGQIVMAGAIMVVLSGIGTLAQAADSGMASAPKEMTKKRAYDPKASFERFSKKLNLTPEQQEKIRPILNDEVKAIWAAHDEAMEKEMKLIEEGRAKVNALLTPEQQKKFNAMRDERKKKCDKEMHRHEAMHDEMIDRGDMPGHGEMHKEMMEEHGEMHK